MKMRKFLWTALILFVMVASSCAPAAAPTAAPAEPTAAPTVGSIQASEATSTPAPTVEASKYKESPALADMVKAGKLPAVDKRLPETPLTTAPVEKVGKYGGTLHTASWWPEVGNVQLYFAVEAPIKWKADLTGYEAGSVESYEWSTDGLTFTMHLRKGEKWSDGEPYTSADWKFYWEDIANNPDVKYQSIPAYLRKADGSPITMEFPDDYTVVWKSDRPQWVQPYFMAQGYWEYAKTMMKPAHYLKQYHPKYDSTKTYKDLEAADKWCQTPGYPCLFAWCTSDVAKDGSSYTFSRNPYYWRIDTDGNQLPYIDSIKVDLVSDDQVRLLNCSQGKYDAGFRICGSALDIPFLQEQAKAGGYHLMKNWMSGAGAWPGYMVNDYYVEGGKNYADDTPEHAKEIRDLLRNKDFRQALSIGFDRQRVIDVVWGGIGTPQAATISPQSWHFSSPDGQKVLKDWQQMFIQFDAAKANDMLDKLGMKKDKDGYRQLPSGKPFTMTVDVSDWGGSLKVQTDSAAEMKNQWEKNLGIKVEIKNLQGQPDLDTRTNEGYYMLRGAHISEIDIMTYPDWMFPVVNRYMFPLEGRWYAKGKDTCKDQPTDASKYPCGVKPEDGSPAQLLQAMYEKAQLESTVEGRHKIVWDAVKLIEEQGPFVIGVSGDQPMPVVIKDNLHNVLDYGVVGPWAPSTPGNQIASQWYFE